MSTALEVLAALVVLGLLLALVCAGIVRLADYWAGR